MGLLFIPIMRSCAIGDNPPLGFSKPASSALLFLATALIDTPSFHGRGLMAKRPRSKQTRRIITRVFVKIFLIGAMLLLFLHIPSQNACVLEPRVNNIEHQANSC